MAKSTNSEIDAQDVTGQISKQLKEFYRSVEEEAIPDRFLDLLEQLDAAEKTASSTSDKAN